MGNQVILSEEGGLIKVDLSVVANSKEVEFFMAFFGQVSAH